MVGSGGGFGVEEVVGEGSEYFRREDVRFKKRVHDEPEILLPLGSVRLWPGMASKGEKFFVLLIVVPCFKMGHFMEECDKERVAVKAFVDGDTGRSLTMGRTEIP